MRGGKTSRAIASHRTGTTRRQPNREALRRACLECLESRRMLATHIWTGVVNDNWSTAGNWIGGVPTSGEAGGTIVVFNTADATVNQDVAGLTIDRLAFDPGSAVTLTLVQNLTINGTTLPNSILADSAANTIAGTGNLILQNAVDIDVPTGATSLSISADITGSGSLAKDGNGSLLITNTTGANTYTGTTFINDGTIAVNSNTGDAALSGNIVVGDNSGAANSDAVLVLNSTFELPDNATVTVQSDGRVDVAAGQEEDISFLNLGSAAGGGQVSIAAGGTFEINAGGQVISAATPTTSTITGAGNFNFENSTGVLVGDGAAAVDLDISSVISSDIAITLTMTGTGTLRYSGALANTYTGTTRITQGVLELNRAPNADNAIIGDVVVGDGTGADDSAVLRLLAIGQINNASSVTVNADGLLEVTAGGGENLGPLTINDGHASVGGTGLLTTGLTMTGGLIDGGSTFFLGGDATATAVAAGSPATITAPTTLQGGARTFNVTNGPGNLDLVLTGNVTTGSIIKDGSGVMIVDGNASTVPFTHNQGVLGGTGSLGSLTSATGANKRVEPGTNDPGTLATGNLAWNASTTYETQLRGGSPGDGAGFHDQISVTGTVSLGGAALDANLGAFSPTGGQQFVIIANDGADAVTGTFAGLAEGATLTIGGVQFRITYAGGTGNDVVLTANAAPVAINGSTTIPEDSVNQVIDLRPLVSDDNTSDANLIYNIVTGPGVGTLTPTGTPGVYNYTPPANANGTPLTSFTFNVTDEGGLTSNTATFTINVTPVNDAPVSTGPVVNTTEDEAVDVTLTASDLETPANQLTFTITSLPTRGALYFNGNPVSVGDTFVGSPVDLVYEPSLSFEGPGVDSFNYSVTDTGDPAGNLGNAITINRTATINIAAAVGNNQVLFDPLTGIVRIGGNDTDQRIYVKPNAAKTRLLVIRNEQTVSSNIPLGDVTEIHIFGRGGDDTLYNANVNVPVVISGGSGDDELRGGSRDDLLFGGNGDDLLVGAAGDDVLIGGAGNDWLNGDGGDDILIGGRTAAALSNTALRDASDDWASSSTMAASLTAPGAIIDTQSDTMRGGGGGDWFLASAPDSVLDFKGFQNDQVTIV